MAGRPSRKALRQTLSGLVCDKGLKVPSCCSIASASSSAGNHGVQRVAIALNRRCSAESPRGPVRTGRKSGRPAPHTNQAVGITRTASSRIGIVRDGGCRRERLSARRSRPTSSAPNPPRSGMQGPHRRHTEALRGAARTSGLSDLPPGQSFIRSSPPRLAHSITPPRARSFAPIPPASGARYGNMAAG